MENKMKLPVETTHILEAPSFHWTVFLCVKCLLDRKSLI